MFHAVSIIKKKKLISSYVAVPQFNIEFQTHPMKFSTLMKGYAFIKLVAPPDLISVSINIDTNQW